MKLFIQLLWKCFWEIICTPHLLFTGAVIEFPKQRNRHVNLISIMAEAVSYCFPHMERQGLHEEGKQRLAFLPARTRNAYEEAQIALRNWRFSYRIVERDLHLIVLEEEGKPIADEVWENLGGLLDKMEGKSFTTNIRNGMRFYYVHELVFPQQEGEAEKRIVMFPTEWNRRIDAILFLAVCAGLYAIYVSTGSLIITAAAMIVFLVIRRTLFHDMIRVLGRLLRLD